MKLSYSQRLLCVILSALMVVAPVNPVFSASAEPSKNKDLTPDDLKRIAKEMDRGFKVLEATTAKIPRDTYNPHAVIKKVGKEPTKLFEWVRDNTYWVPYHGSLRGHIGVLMDRLGNSLDRSLLLVELLRLTGHNVRLAHGELTDAQAEKTLLEIRTPPRNPLPVDSLTLKKDRDKQLEEYSSTYGLNSTAVLEYSSKSSARVELMSEEIAERVAEQTAMIIAAIGNSGGSEDTRRSIVLAALRDHWWVQTQVEGSWVDWDPMLPGSSPGQALTEVKSVLEDSQPGTPIRLDSKFCHEVGIRIVIEQWRSGSGLEETCVLEHTFRPSESFTKSISVSNYPLDWPGEAHPFGSAKPLEALRGVIVEQKEWLPILYVGEHVHFHKAFNKEGGTFAPRLTPEGKLAGEIEEAMKGPTRVLDTLFGPRSKDERHLTAEWIEFEIKSPGRPMRKIRRPVFDLIGPAGRADNGSSRPKLGEAEFLDRDLSLFWQTEILVQVCQLSPYFVAHNTAVNLLANRKVMLALLRGADAENQAQFFTEQFKKIKPGPSARLDLLALLRRALSRGRDGVFVDQPNILTFFTGLGARPGKGVVMRQGFDIIANEMGVHLEEGAPGFDVLLEQGVLDTNIEAALVGPESKNTAELFARSSHQGISWQVLRGVQDPAWTKMRLPLNARARLQQNLKKGYIVLAPEKPVDVDGQLLVGWWRINQSTGSVLGMMETGRGQSMTEKLVTLIIGFWPLLVGGYIGFVSCAGFNPSENSIAKNVGCIFCAIIAAICFEAVYLGWIMGPGIIWGCGFGVVSLGLGACFSSNL